MDESVITQSFNLFTYFFTTNKKYSHSIILFTGKVIKLQINVGLGTSAESRVPNCIYVTSFLSISCLSNSEYWSQQTSQSGNIHNINNMSMLQA